MALALVKTTGESTQTQSAAAPVPTPANDVFAAEELACGPSSSAAEFISPSSAALCFVLGAFYYGIVLKI